MCSAILNATRLPAGVTASGAAPHSEGQQPSHARQRALERPPAAGSTRRVEARLEGIFPQKDVQISTGTIVI